MSLAKDKKFAMVPEKNMTKRVATPGEQARQSAHTHRVRDLWDSRADDWPGKYANGRLTGRLPLFAGELQARLGHGSVLDLGCGSGELARHLTSIGHTLTGCDIAPQMLERAREADADNAVSWIQLEPGWTTLPLPSNSQDAVVAASVLEYVPDVSMVLREVARVLRPNGFLLCTVPDMTHPVRWGEWPLRLIAGITPFRSLCGRAWPRLNAHLTYLRLSRQRRSVRWWRARGREAALKLTPLANGAAPRSRLQLLAFTRSAHL